MIHSPSQIVVRWLEAVNLCTDASWPARSSIEVNNPDDVITVYDTTGLNDMRDMHGNLWQHYGLQVRARSATYDGGYDKLETIRRAMAVVSMASVTIDGVEYTIFCFAKMGPVLRIGTDAPTSKRRLFTMNLFVTIQ